MKKITQYLSIMALSLLIYSCVGPQGERGEDGNANVGSAIYDVAPSKWVGNADGYTTTLKVPEITQDIYENGAVLVYMMKNEGSADQSFNMLPYTWLNNSITEYMDYDAFIGSIDITLRWTDNGVNSTNAPGDPYAFKVVVIEGTPLSVLKTQVDISNPYQVMSYMSGSCVY